MLGCFTLFADPPPAFKFIDMASLGANNLLAWLTRADPYSIFCPTTDGVTIRPFTSLRYANVSDSRLSSAVVYQFLHSMLLFLSAYQVYYFEDLHPYAMRPKPYALSPRGLPAPLAH